MWQRCTAAPRISPWSPLAAASRSGKNPCFFWFCPVSSEELAAARSYVARACLWFRYRADDLLQRRAVGHRDGTGLPVRGSNRVMVIRTCHNSTLTSRRAGCHVGGTLPVPGKAHLPWIVCWSCAEYGRPRDPVALHGGPRAYRTSASAMADACWSK